MTTRLPEATISRTEVGDGEEGYHGRNERVPNASVEGDINIGFRQEQVSAGGNQDIPDAIGKNLWPNGTVELEDHGGMLPGEGIRKQISAVKE